MTLVPNPRRGGIAVWALLVIPVGLALTLLAVVTTQVSLLAEEVRRTADAAAHAGVAEVASDAVLEARLAGRPARLEPTRTAVYEAAARAAAVNLVRGRSLVPEDGDAAEVELGTVDGFGGPVTFRPAGPSDLAAVNAVRVRLVRTGKRGVRLVGGFRENVVVTATAKLEENVVGFAPVSPTAPAPVCPVALDRRAWDAGIAAAGGAELPEIEFRLMAGPDAKRKPTAVPLTIGTTKPAELARQVETGVVADQFARFTAAVGTPFEIAEKTGRLVVPGDRFTGPGYDALLAALEKLQKSGDARAWPTTVRFAPDDDRAVWVTDFVAARVVRVAEEIDAGRDGPADAETGDEDPEATPPAGVKAIRVVLRPTLLSTPAAVTRPTAPPNPYLGRVRLMTADRP